ncbi:MAG: glycosidase, partial [Tannerella sp.]|nr:glycosidase [Tannerella sp.]
MENYFNTRLNALTGQYEKLIRQKNEAVLPGNGIYERYKYPVLTAGHAPLIWKYDLSPATNPCLIERFGINGTFNAGAIKWEGQYVLMVRVEGNDRKSFFAI